MDQAHFPWRPLGTLLVDKGLLTAAGLEQALAEQQRSGRLLGQILVACGYLTGLSLARALAEQHGVELRPTSGSETHAAIDPGRVHSQAAPRQIGSTEDQGQRAWRPLGKLLVEKGFLSATELDQALGEQRQRPDRRLGEILVTCGHLSGPALARALAEQHGVDLDARNELGVDLRTVIRPPTPAQPIYQVCEVIYKPSYERSVLYESANFLEAADFALEFLEDQQPDALEIQRTHGEERETVWTYSESRADAVAASRKDLVETFGFDPTRWDAAARFDRETRTP